MPASNSSMQLNLDGPAAVDAVHLAWETSAHLVLRERDLLGQAVAFAASVAAASVAAAAAFPAASASCAFIASSGKKLRAVDYSHRKRRPHELSTAGLYQLVKQAADGFTEFALQIPVTVNHYPLQLSTGFNISQPFGGWNAAFFPTDGRYNPSFRSPQKIEAQPPLFAATFRQAVVTHGHVTTCSGYAFTAGGCLWDFRMPRIDTVRDVIATDIAVALCDEWCKGYYHFTHEHLPRLALVHHLLLTNNRSRLVLSHAPTKFQLQFIVDVLGIPRERVIHGAAVFGALVVYPMPQRCGNTFTHVLYMLRGIVQQRLQLQAPAVAVSASAAGDTPRKFHLLFAERRKLSRMPRNYDAIKERLVQEFAASLTFASTFGDGDATSQIRMFHDSDIVLGPHGANIANTMWMRPGAHVLEMASWRKGNMCYYTTSSRINVTHHLILHSHGKDAAYELEYTYVRDHVGRALQMLQRAGS